MGSPCLPSIRSPFQALQSWRSPIPPISNKTSTYRATELGLTCHCLLEVIIGLTGRLDHLQKTIGMGGGDGCPTGGM